MQALEGRTYFGLGYNLDILDPGNCACSANPISYENGTPVIVSTDLSSKAFGHSWTQQRNWVSVNNGSQNGNGWMVSNLPYLALEQRQSHGGIVQVIQGGAATMEFAIGATEPVNFTVRDKNDQKVTLKYVPSYTDGASNRIPGMFLLTDEKGNVTKFFDLPRANAATLTSGSDHFGQIEPGTTQGVTTQWFTPGGSSSSYTSTDTYRFGAYAGYSDASGKYSVNVHYDSSGNLDNVTRTDGAGNYERFKYGYSSIGNGTITMSVVSSLTQQTHSASDSPGIWTIVRSVEYQYYTGGTSSADDAQGRLGDLKFAFIVDPAKNVSVSNLSYTSGTHTVTATTTSHSYKVGDLVLISGASQDAFNGFVAITAKTSTTFSYSITSGSYSNETGSFTAKRPTDVKYYRYYKFHTYSVFPSYVNPENQMTGTGSSGTDKSGGTDASFGPRNSTSVALGIDAPADNMVMSGLKDVVEGAAFYRLAAIYGTSLGAVPDADTVSGTDYNGDGNFYNDDIRSYANNVFSYERYYNYSTQYIDPATIKTKYRVVQEIAAGAGCSSCSGGFGTSKLVFQPNTSHLADPYDYNDSGVAPNTWVMKTTEYIPDETNADTNHDGVVDSGQWDDNNYNVVYTNEQGQVMLKVAVDSNGTAATADDKKVATYYHYDAAGRNDFIAHPSALKNYSTAWESNVDLVLWGGGSSNVLSSVGLIDHYEYATSTTGTISPTVAGDVNGYLKNYSVRKGYSGTDKLVSSKDYYQHTYSGAIVHPVAHETQYFDVDKNGTDDAVVTTHDYSWRVDGSSVETNRVLSETITYPSVGTSQNGSNSTTSKITFFDQDGHAVWVRDQSGYITYNEYDKTGVATKQVVDVQTTLTTTFSNLPSGWSTPAGAGLHLTTTREVDELGRTTKLTDPKGKINYTVYNDDNHEYRRYSGWSAGTTTGPIEVVRQYRPAANAASGQRTAYSEHLYSSATPTTNTLTGLPLGTETIDETNITKLSRDLSNDAGQLTERDKYFTLSGVTYAFETAHLGTASNNSSTGNYHMTLLDYDPKSQIKREESPSGTITRTFYDAQERPISTWVGTDDTPTSGYFSPTNIAGTNMVLVTLNQYDNADGNLIRSTSYPGGSAAPRTTVMMYDWRDRLVMSKQGMQSSESDTSTNRTLTYYEYDNAGHVITTEQYDGDNIPSTASSPSLNVAGFESPVLPSSSGQESPWQPWTFSGGAGFDSSAASVPNGGSVQQYIPTYMDPYTDWDIVISAAQIDSGTTINIYMGDQLVGEFTPTDTSTEPFVTPGFNLATPGSQTIRLEAAGGSGVLIDAVTIEDGSTLYPVLWDNSFDGLSGWSGSGAYGIYRSVPAAPVGLQNGYLNATNTTVAEIHQSATFSSGSYFVTFKAAQANSNNNTLKLYLDNVLVDTITPDSTSFKQYSSLPFAVTAGSHTIKFELTAPVSSLQGTALDDIVITGFVADATADGIPDKPSSGLLRGRTKFDYDQLGRQFATHTFSVSNSGSVSSTSLDSKSWFDARGKLIKSSAPGGLVSKTEYDGAGRATKVYQTNGGGDSVYGDADDVTGDAVLSQSEYQYDANGNVIFTIQRDRFHDATLPGGLGNPGSTSPTPQARVSYTENYYDNANRLTDSVNLGTNGGTTKSSPDSSAPARSDTALRKTYSYDAGGHVSSVVDPRGKEARAYYDLLGRKTKAIGNYVDGTPSASDDQTTHYTYNGADQILTMKAEPTSGSFQTTQYIYGLNQSISTLARSGGTATASLSSNSMGYKVGQSVTISGANNSYYNGTFTITAVNPTADTFQFAISTSAASSATGASVRPADDVVSNDLLSAVRYPDKSSSSASEDEQETFTYNALGERQSYTDRNGNIHSYSYDLMGRPTSDAVTTLGSGVDGSVRRIDTNYDTAGRVYQITSYNAASSGSVVNQIEREYNGFGQMTKEYQATSGSVNTSTTPKVQYTYSEMPSGANHSRLTQMIYPNGRIIRYEYGTSSGVFSDATNDSISRLTYIASDSSGSVGTHLEEYDYLGLGTVVDRWHPESLLELTYIDTPGDAGDQYSGLDRFGRVAIQWWLNGSGTADKYTYTYDRNGNVLSKTNTEHTAYNETYSYDDLNRLSNFSRGSHTQAWSLDATGNWTSLNTNSAGAVSRTHNRQNQITQVGSSPTLAYDGNGNLSTDESSTGLKYDAWNRLISVTRNSATTTASQYVYDGLGRRVSEKKSPQTQPQQLSNVNASGDVTRRPFANVNGTLFFAGYDGTNGTELWKSDGTAAGTVLVKNICSGVTGSYPSLLTNVNGTLYFVADDGVHGNELWKSDGTSSGTVLVKDINTVSSTQISNMIAIGSTLFFAANDGTNGTELWSSDGTSGGTNMVKNIHSTGSSTPNTLVNINGTLYFAATDTTNGRELWKSDGTSSGTVIVKDIHTTGSSSPQFLTNVNGTLYFSASESTNGRELWQSDGTSSGTVLVKNIYAGTSNSNPSSLIAGNGVVFFNADDGSHGRELWVSDGTSGGTNLVKDIWSGTGSSLTTTGIQQVVVNGILLIAVEDGTNGVELWRSDGTTVGTSMVKDINPASGGSGYPYELVESNGMVYFSANDDELNDNTELWMSDGTAAGTVKVSEVDGGASYPTEMTNVDGVLYYSDSSTYGLWKLDTRPTQLYYSDSWQVLEERDGSGATTTQNVWSPVYVDAMIERDRDTDANGSLDERLYAMQDANYNVTGLVNTSSNVVERYQYDPYGTPTVLNSDWSVDEDGVSDVSWVYLHQGGRYDSGVSLYSFRHRDYDPDLGRWVQQDPAGYVDGANRYLGLTDNPIAKVDPQGYRARGPADIGFPGPSGDMEMEFNRDDVTACSCGCIGADCHIETKVVTTPGNYIRINRISKSTGQNTFTDLVAEQSTWTDVSMLYAAYIVGDQGQDVTGCNLHQWVTKRHTNPPTPGFEGPKPTIDYPVTGGPTSTDQLYGGWFLVDQPARSGSPKLLQWDWEAVIYINENPNVTATIGFGVSRTGNEASPPPPTQK